MKYIELTQGKKAIVDDEDFEELSKSKWYTHRKYAACHQKNPMVVMHRIILGAKKGQQVDHINGDGLDNRRENLRFCTQAENQWNRRKQKNNTSGFKGVVLNQITGKWVAQITVKGKAMNLGYFVEKKDAAETYDKAAFRYYGEFARLNNIQPAI